MNRYALYLLALLISSAAITIFLLSFAASFL